MFSFLHKDNSSRLIRFFYLGFAALVAILYDVFFWKQERGFGFFIFVSLYVSGFLLLAIGISAFRKRWPLLLLVPVFVMSADTLLYTNQLTRMYVPLFVVVLLVFFSALVLLQNPEKHPFAFFHIPLFRDIELMFRKWGLLFRDLFHWREKSEDDLIRKIMLGVVIAAPILLLFIVLFSKADAVFAQLLTNLFDAEAMGWRIFRSSVIALWLAGFFYVIVSESHVLQSHETRMWTRVDPIIVGVVLGLLDALFLIFIAIQLRYLFGAKTFVLENGMAFAEYARSGFFELAWVIFFAACILVFVYRAFFGKKIPFFITLLKLILIAQIGIIAISALRRMNVYQAEYGYTVLRLYVEWFIYFTMILLITAGGFFASRVSFRRFVHTALVLGVVASTVVASVNVDRVIAEENVDRFLHDKKELDISYLSQLSPDVLPSVARLLQEKNPRELSIDMLLDIERFLTDMEKKVAAHDTARELHRGVLSFQKAWLTIPPAAFDAMRWARVRNHEYNQLEVTAQNFRPSGCSPYESLSGPLPPALKNFSCIRQVIADDSGAPQDAVVQLREEWSTTTVRYSLAVYDMNPIPVFRQTIGAGWKPKFYEGRMKEGSQLYLVDPQKKSQSEFGKYGRLPANTTIIEFIPATRNVVGHSLVRKNGVYQLTKFVIQ